MAVSFNGTTQYITCGSGSTLTNLFDSGGTICCWARRAGAGENNLGRYMSKEGTTGVVGWLCGNEDAVGEDNVRFISVRDTVDGDWRSPRGGVVVNTWYHIAVTYDADATANDPIIYVNGASVTVTENVAPVGPRTSDSGTAMFIGNNATTATRTFNGKIADCRAYDRILSAAEIATIHGTQGADRIVNGLLGRWSLAGQNAAVIGTIVDLSGNGNSGSGGSAPTFSDDVLRFGRRRG